MAPFAHPSASMGVPVEAEQIGSSGALARAEASTWRTRITFGLREGVAIRSRHRHPRQADHLAERIALHTGQSIEQVEADSDRDRWFTAEQAKEYGMIDAVIERARRWSAE